MANISILSRLVAGAQRNVDLSTNTLVVGVVKVGGSGGTDLTKAILDNLVLLQAGGDVGSSLHTHDSLYYRKTELNSASPGTSGSTLVGDDNSYTNFTNSGLTLKSALTGIDTALGSSTAASAMDSTFRIKNTADNTKQISFLASAITTGTTRQITMADANVDLADVNNAILKNGSRAFTANQPMGAFKLTGLAAGSGAGDSVRYEQAILTSGANAWAANQDLGGFKITGSADPVNPQDLATKAYTDAVALGLSPKKAARVATLANITLSGTQTIDTIAVVAGDRVLVKNQTSAADNGIYVVSASAWSRSTDMDSLTPIDEFNGAWVPVQLGSQAGQIYVQYGVVTTVGTSAVNFEFYNPLAALVGGDMITVSGSTISVDLAAASGLESSNPGVSSGQLRVKLEATNPSLKFTGSNELAVKLDPAGALASGASGVAVQVDGSSLEISSNALRIKAAGVLLSHLASNSVDENKIVSTSFDAAGAISGGSGTKIKANVDGSTLEIASNQIRQKDGGTTAAKLNTNVADQLTITGGAGTALSVVAAPLVKQTFVAGEAFAANTTYLVRMGMFDLGDTVGSVYKADKDASSDNKWVVIGWVNSASSVIAGGSVVVNMVGTAAPGSFSNTQIGREVFLGSAGAQVVGASLANTTNEAQVAVGVVTSVGAFLFTGMNMRGIA